MCGANEARHGSPFSVNSIVEKSPICVIVFSLPQGAAGAWWTDDFDWKYVNYAPFTVLAVIIAVGLWWLISARHTFTGPIRQVATDDTGRVIEGREDEPPPPTA